MTPAPSSRRAGLACEPPEAELRLDGDRLARDFGDWVGEEVDRAGDGAGLDDQVAPPAQFDAVGGVMPEVVRRQGGVLVGLADVHRPPPALGVELCPAVVA